MNTVYFAHPISDYGTPWESAAETAISRALPDFAIISPNAPWHDAAYREQGIGYFTTLAGGCDAVVAAPFPDGNYGAGVGKECFAAAMKRLPIYLIDRETLSIRAGVVGPLLTVKQTRQWVAHFRAFAR